ncbi:hypothetical protein ACFVSQ_38610 [Streptomyces niveus]
MATSHRDHPRAYGEQASFAAARACEQGTIPARTGSRLGELGV